MLAWGVLGFAISLAGTWLARSYALRNALLDHPGERRSHQTPTPRGGGIAIVAAALALLAWLAWTTWPAATATRAWVMIGLGLAVVAAAGWRDDHRDVAPPARLAAHILAAALLAHALVLMGADPIQAGATFALAIVLVNVWNFMDGIDSLAASQALVAAGAYALFAGGGEVAVLGTVVAAACAGFLPFNLPRARIFLGDVGSGSLGYLLAALAGLVLLETPWSRAPLLLLPLLVFGVDASLTLARRIVRGERWWQAHVQHAYQAWVRRGAGHGLVASAYLAASLLAVALMFLASAHSFAGIMVVVGFSCAAACLAWSRLQQGRTRAGRDS